MKRLNGAGTRAMRTVREFTVAQRTIAIIGVAVLLLGGIALTNWLGRPTMAPLFTSLAGADASAIVEQLKAGGVDYELADGGGTILVPEGDVAGARMAAAAAGLPSGTASGYTLLDDMGVTASEFQQSVTYKRAIEGELAGTIEAIDGVGAATVQLAVPEKTVFTEQEEQPTASVFVKAETPLSSDQVGAIVHLVSASYPGLTKENVSVVDQKGTTLSAVGGGTTGGTAQQASDYESRTRAAVQAMLDKVFGPGMSTVTVAADVSSSSGTTRSETYETPEQSPVISESVNDSSYTGAGGTAASGVLGSDTAAGATGTGTATGTGAGSGSGNYTQKQGVKNNAVNKTVREETITPGTLNRQTIAVAIDTSVAGQISVPSLQQLVANAAGIDRARGDSISVTSVAFSTESTKAAADALKQAEKAKSAEAMTSIVTTAIQVVGGLLLLVIVLLVLRKLFAKAEPDAGALDAGRLDILQIPVDGAHGLTSTGPTSQLGGPGGYGMPSVAAPPTVLLPEALPAPGQFAQLQADVDALAGADPDRTAEYLRALMSDRTPA